MNPPRLGCIVAAAALVLALASCNRGQREVHASAPPPITTAVGPLALWQHRCADLQHDFRRARAWDAVVGQQAHDRASVETRDLYQVVTYGERAATAGITMRRLLTRATALLALERLK